MTRVLALDHGQARCGCAISDPSGTVVRPLEVVEDPDSERGLEALERLVAREGAQLVVVGLPVGLSGREGLQARRARSFAQRLRDRLAVPVEMHDERFTTRLAQRGTGRAPEDSRAAAHLLEAYLGARPEGGEQG